MFELHKSLYVKNSHMMTQWKLCAVDCLSSAHVNLTVPMYNMDSMVQCSFGIKDLQLCP